MKCIAEKVIDIAFMTQNRSAVAAVLCTNYTVSPSGTHIWRFFDGSHLQRFPNNAPMKEWCVTFPDGKSRTEFDMMVGSEENA